MARLHKISGYVVDIDESFCKFELENILERMDMIVHHTSIESVDIGEWEDDNLLNYTDCNLEECEKWFSKEEIIESEPVKQWIDKMKIRRVNRTDVPVVMCPECGIMFCDLINNHHYMYRYCPHCGK